ncbi:MAG: T9SS type A sorting domain-containing protein, partial [Bacteroidota bacterium]
SGLESNTSAMVLIYDLRGIVVLQKQLTENSNQLDLTRIGSNGVYLMKLISDNKTLIRRIVLEK